VSVFETERKILFQHCDPAGIVFYPRYFELMNSVVEEWFEDEIGVSFAEIHGVRGAAVPAVHIDVDFQAASRLGDRLTFSLTVERLGGASAALKIAARAAEEPRLSATLVIAHVDAKVSGATPFPDDLRAPIERFMQGS
jgi:4-hydroxybenzoyl-CoA thioesterase